MCFLYVFFFDATSAVSAGLPLVSYIRPLLSQSTNVLLVLERVYELVNWRVQVTKQGGYELLKKEGTSY